MPALPPITTTFCPRSPGSGWIGEVPVAMLMIPPLSSVELRLPPANYLPGGGAHRWRLSLLLLCCRGRLRGVSLIPAVEARQVARVPCLTESRSTQIPVGTDFARHCAEIVPKIDDRWAPPEPVAVVNPVNHQARLEHESVRNHRIVVRVCVLLYLEVFLNLSLRVG